MTPTPVDGARVRVTFEATYSEPFGDRHIVAVRHGLTLWTLELPADAVLDVLPDVPNVGDVITSATQLDALPCGSIVCRRDVDGVPFRKISSGWAIGVESGTHAEVIASWGDAVVLRVGGGK